MASFAAVSPIVISPANPAVVAGQSLTISADRPVTFQLSGAGALSSASANSVAYSAPASIGAQHSLSGCMVLPNDSVFNTRIDSLPIHSSSTQWTPWATQNGVFVLYSWGTTIVTSATPTAPQYFGYTTQLNGGEFPVLPISQRKREGGAYTTDSINDHHLLTINRDTCQIYETYQDNVPVVGCPECTAASGWTYASTSYQQPTGGTTDAAGLPIAALTFTLNEIQAGAINHALRFTACTGCVSNQSLWPATGSTGGQPGAPPMGARFRLKSNFDVTPFPRAAQIVLKALQQYGMILADIGTSGGITASSDVTEDASVVRELSTLLPGVLQPGDFEIVDESSLITQASSHQVNPNNGYVTPLNYAVLTVTDAANAANTVQVPIALQPVSIGTQDPVITVQAGTPGFPIPYWVTGTSNQAVNWNIIPATAGTIASDGTYTAPLNVSGVIAATITGISVADPNASTQIQINVIPAGLVRIDTGSPISTTDDNGNVWLPDMAFETGSFAQNNDSNPVGAWGPTNATIWQTYTYTWGDDLVYRFHVPDGAYNIGLTFGVGGCSGMYNREAWDNGLIWGPLNIETQGNVMLANWDMGPGINWQCRTPETISVPAMVTDTNLTVAVRATGGNGAHSAPILHGLTISPATLPVQAFITTSALTFPTQAVGTTSTPQSVTVWNSGTASLGLLGITIAGPNATDFSVAANCPASLDAGASCQLSVTFSPSAPGTRSATLRVADSSASSPELVTLTGSGWAMPTASLSATALNFGNVVLTTNTQQVISISNTGNAPLLISAASVTGQNATDFSVANNCSAVGVGSSCQISVICSPLAVGPRSAILTIVDSAANSPQTVSLSAIGIGAASHFSNSAYTYSLPVVIHHELVPSSDLVNFPLLFEGVYPFLASISNSGNVQNPNGYDIIFASDAAGGNKLNFERAAYDATTGYVRYWVQVPRLSHATDTVIYLLYGAADPSAADPSTPAQTWNAGYKAVWHLDETSGTTLHDSAQNGNDAMKISSADPEPTLGLIGGAQLFANTTFSAQGGNFAQTSVSPSTNIFSTGISISAIINCTAPNVYGGIYRRTAAPSDQVTSAQVAVSLNEQAGGDIEYWVEGNGVDFPAAYTANTWAYITITHDFSSGTVSLYRNGALIATNALSNVPMNQPGFMVVLGNRAYGSGNHTFPGVIDEIMVNSTVLSPDWIAAQYNNVTHPETFYSVGTNTGTITGSGELTVTPTTVDFGSTPVNSVSLSKTITIANVGSSPARLTSLAISGAGFAMSDQCGTSVAPGASCQAVVTFSPGAAVGAQSGTVTLASPGTPSLSVPLTALVTGVPQLTITPTTVDFGALPIGHTLIRTVMVTNTGTGSATLGALAPENANAFAATKSCPASLPPGGNCSLIIGFTASSTTAESTLISLSSNAGISTFSVTGSGLQSAWGTLRPPLVELRSKAVSVRVPDARPGQATAVTPYAPSTPSFMNSSVEDESPDIVDQVTAENKFNSASHQ
ncbi:MAG: choice-of-anchor D domain-containing protein, partial [Acidobacteriaceae bacterium]|nr:choice-of-anchor D domain-containing protein [Acidobacteriaceae bacterium]